MHRLVWLLLIASACGAHAPPAPSAVSPPGLPPDAGVAAAPRAPKAPVALEEYFNTRRFGPPRFSAGDKWVAYSSDEGGRPDVWVQPLSGGPAHQITHVQGFLHGYDFSPTRDQLVFGADVAGDEFSHLFLTDSAGTAPRDITADLPAGRRADFVEWALDGKTFLYVSTLRDPRFMDLYEYEVGSGKSKLLWTASGSLALAVVSRDHRRFVLQDTLSDVDSNLYLLERGSHGKPRLLTPHKGSVLYAPTDFSKDGKTLFVTSDAGGEFQALYAMTLPAGKMKSVRSESWDVDGAGFSPHHRWFFSRVNEDGLPRATVSDARTHKALTLPAAPGAAAWDPQSFSWSDRYLGVLLRGDATPGAPYVIDLKTGQARALAEPLPPSLRDHRMAAARSVRVASFDGKQIPAFLYTPDAPAPGSPGILLIHGGPTSQSLRRFSPFVQYFASKGYVVQVPNVRGSTGYGKSWTVLDNKDFGGGPLKDVVACKQWLVQNAGVPADKVVIAGGSYGGYMVLAAATFTPTEFAAQVDYFGVSELKSLVEQFPAYWESAKAFIYAKFGDPNDPKDVQYMHERSPLYFVDRIQRPLLVVQGDKDVRVKKDQSDRIVGALRARNVPVDYLILKDEGHGFSRNESQIAAYGATDRFLDRHLFGDTSVVVVP
jgi:dipeptidyl aminopeptidase/acylaminoacyl peptidase